MSSLLGFDLNGLWDFVAVSDGTSKSEIRDLGIHGSLVRLAADQDRWVGGQQSALSPNGKGSGWGIIGGDENRLFWTNVLVELAGGDLIEDRAAAVKNFLEALSIDAGNAVFAVPDISGFDEAARDRLLRLLERVPRLRSTLLWRHVGAVLGWVEEDLNVGRIQPFDGQRVAVLSLMDNGIHLGDVKLVRDTWQGRDLWIPERDKPGVEAGEVFAGASVARRVAQDLAAKLSVTEEIVLKTINAPWRIAVGEKTDYELMRMPDRSWHKIPEGVTRKIEVELPRLPDTIRTRLAYADSVLVEGPMAKNSDWVDAVLQAAGLPKDRRVYSSKHAFWSPKALTAKGCLVAAKRAQAGIPVYYDFLPQLEINALVGNEPRFVALIPQNKRLLGGEVYKGVALGDFAISNGAKQLSFYLFKQDFEHGRKAEVRLPEESNDQHPIRVSVEQSPGQGFARVRIESDSFEPFRRKPYDLVWSEMEVVQETRGKILEAITRQTGLAYPDVVTTPGHALLWHPRHPDGDLLEQLQAYIKHPLLTAAGIDDGAHAALQKLRKRFSEPGRPSFLAHRMKLNCEDIGNFRALDSRGNVPPSKGELVVPEEGARLLVVALAKAANELDSLMAQFEMNADKKVIGDIIGFASWCYWRCPESIADFLLKIYEENIAISIPPALLRAGIGRVVHRASELPRYFGAVHTRLSTTVSLTAQEFSALGRVLGGCDEAAEKLSSRTANEILQTTHKRLQAENDKSRTNAYKVTFKFVLLMLAALLRHRKAKHNFLDPASRAAKELMKVLSEALVRNQQFEQKASGFDQRRFARNATIIRELLNQIKRQGADPNIIRKIEELEDEE